MWRRDRRVSWPRTSSRFPEPLRVLIDKLSALGQ
jgi:hypothetical protein